MFVRLTCLKLLEFPPSWFSELCWPPVGPYVAGGPVGPDVYNTDPDSLTHMVRILPDPDGQDAAATGTPSPSDCYPVGPVGLYVTGGPVGPDVYNTDPDSLTHMVRIPPDPDGQDAAATGTPSPSDCYPAGPAGPYVAGGPVGPDDCLSALESCEHLVPDHADPVGQYDVDLDTAESLQYAVIENILDGRPMEGITCPELLEYSLRLLDATLDGGLVERISEWKPVITPARSYSLDSRPYGGDNLPGASSSGGVPGQWTYGGGVVSGTAGAVGSWFVVSCTTC